VAEGSTRTGTGTGSGAGGDGGVGAGRVGGFLVLAAAVALGGIVAYRRRALVRRS
jgi:hypothetical protein